MKKFFNRITCLMLIASALFIECEEDKSNNNLNPDDVRQGSTFDYVRYGISFNMCLGYCMRQVEITESDITFLARGWNFTDTIPDITCSQDITSDEWYELYSKIDMDAFNSLPEFIGCPDCADGGAEWIEISKEGDAHKVTFEYGDAPEEVESYINILRSYMHPDIYCQ